MEGGQIEQSAVCLLGVCSSLLPPFLFWECYVQTLGLKDAVAINEIWGSKLKESFTSALHGGMDVTLLPNHAKELNKKFLLIQENASWLKENKIIDMIYCQEATGNNNSSSCLVQGRFWHILESCAYPPPSVFVTCWLTLSRTGKFHQTSFHLSLFF